MKVLSKDNIVVRTLLNVLDPSADQLDLCAKKKHAKMAKFRVSMRAPVAEPQKRPTARPARIVVLERLSSSTISVSWSDACSGRYTEQVWRTGLARDTAVCALTGRPISRGDPVFRPRKRDVYVTGNQDRMILAATIEQRSDLSIGAA